MSDGCMHVGSKYEVPFKQNASQKSSRILCILYGCNVYAYRRPGLYKVEYETYFLHVCSMCSQITCVQIEGQSINGKWEMRYKELKKWDGNGTGLYRLIHK